MREKSLWQLEKFKKLGHLESICSNGKQVPEMSA